METRGAIYLERLGNPNVHGNMDDEAEQPAEGNRRQIGDEAAAAVEGRKNNSLRRPETSRNGIDSVDRQKPRCFSRHHSCYLQKKNQRLYVEDQADGKGFVVAFIFFFCDFAGKFWSDGALAERVRLFPAFNRAVMF